MKLNFDKAQPLTPKPEADGKKGDIIVLEGEQGEIRTFLYTDNCFEPLLDLETYSIHGWSEPWPIENGLDICIDDYCYKLVDLYRKPNLTLVIDNKKGE